MAKPRLTRSCLILIFPLFFLTMLAGCVQPRVWQFKAYAGEPLPRSELALLHLLGNCNLHTIDGTRKQDIEHKWGFGNAGYDIEFLPGRHLISVGANHRFTHNAGDSFFSPPYDVNIDLEKGHSYIMGIHIYDHTATNPDPYGRYERMYKWIFTMNDRADPNHQNLLMKWNQGPRFEKRSLTNQ